MGCNVSKTNIAHCDIRSNDENGNGDALHRNIALPKKETKGIQWGLRAGLTCKQVAFNYQGGAVPTQQWKFQSYFKVGAIEFMKKTTFKISVSISFILNLSKP